jgi:hypothetical protein
MFVGATDSKYGATDAVTVHSVKRVPVQPQIDLSASGSSDATGNAL